MVDQQLLSKYASCMEEIKRRTEVIQAFLSGKANAVYRQTNAESICLQFRKILELIALSSLVANKEEYSKNRQKFATDWHAKRILSDIEKVNPKFYPEPTRQILDKDTGKVIKVEKIADGFLTRDEFEDLYDSCGVILHADNPFRATKDIDSFLKATPKYMKKIIKLLNHHQIQLSEDDLQFWVLMKSNTDGKVQVSLFQRVKDDA